jgi:hypothetical protein
MLHYLHVSKGLQQLIFISILWSLATSCKIQLSSLISRFGQFCDTMSACLTIPATTGFIVSKHVSCTRQCFTSGSITSWLCSALWIIVCLFVLFRVSIVLYVHRLMTASEYPFDIFKYRRENFVRTILNI